MSAYQEIRTEFRDLEALIAALCAVGTRMHPGGLTRDMIEIHADPVALVGYQGDARDQKAHVVIRRQNAGGLSNDLGFARDNDGRFRAIVSNYDSSAQGPNWLRRVTQQYARAHVLAQAKRAGYRVTEKVNADGSIRLVCQR